MYKFGAVSNSIMIILNFVRTVQQFWMYARIYTRTQNQPYMHYFVHIMQRMSNPLAFNDDPHPFQSKTG
jgi:hypothetical protein